MIRRSSEILEYLKKKIYIFFHVMRLKKEFYLENKFLKNLMKIGVDSIMIKLKT